jgi:two-component system NtrC family sensor kinase
MAGLRLSWHLNIRQKVILGFIVLMLLIGLIGALSYTYLHTIELKQHVVEIADDLRDTIMEMRRYEKNYLLYGSAEDLKENQKYTQEALETLAKIVPEVKNLKVSSQLDHLREELLAYGNLMEQMPAPLGHAAERSQPRSSPTLEEQEEQLRGRGKRLVEHSRQLVTFERQRILEIINSLKTQLLSSIVLFLFFGGFLIFIVSRKVIRPLRVIEGTTTRIAQGDFRPLPVLETRDETQRVVEAFNRMVAELEKRQNQLVQSKKMSSLGILTAGIAHQLNNPLNNISTSCQIILEELDQGDMEFFKKMLTNIEQEVNRSRDIVKGLLEFSRVRDFSLKPIPLEDVVKRSIKLISSQVPPGIDIVEEVPWDLVLQIDAQRLQEVFLNLLMNAIQAIKETPGEIRIAARVDQVKEQAVITVEDTGGGIPKEELDRVFDPFFSTKEVGLGTGLGLSIVYGIIEKHHGTISVESQVGEGTRFIIRLPLRAAASSEEQTS